MEAQQKSFSCVGTVQVVNIKYAYVDTPKGSVFCPLNASIPSDEFVPDMSRRYHVGDAVRVDVVPQEAKNGCAYRAKKMRHIKSQLPNGVEQSPYGDPSTLVGTSCTATIGHIDVGHMIADSIEFGGVFVARAVFGAFEKDYPELQPGDNLALIIRPQQERNNCRWVALSVEQIHKMTPSTTDIITGSGIVLEVEPLMAVVDSISYGTIICPVLNWIGGDMETSAFGLNEILHPGDSIAFEAVEREGVNRAIRWSFINDLKKRPITKLDSYTQTMPSLQDYIIRLVLPQLESMKDKPLVKLFLDSFNCDEEPE